MRPKKIGRVAGTPLLWCVGCQTYTMFSLTVTSIRYCCDHCNTPLSTGREQDSVVLP